MKIKDILTLDFSEDIKNVIDLEDVTEAEIKTEIEGYIVTEGLAKEYVDFADKYTSNNAETGVWLSGFYGSGKSYFGKLLGYMLNNRMIAGTPARDRILQRFGGIKNEALVKNSISRLSSVPSNVVFLDIAKQNTSKGLAYALFRNFLKTLNLPQNEHGFLLYNLMTNENQVDVTAFISENTRYNWQEIRSKRVTYIKIIKGIFLDKDNHSDKDYENIMETIRRDIDQFSAARLKEEIENYLKIKSNERIVFLFDETSEALTQQKFNLLDLEGVSEALSTLGGKVWTIAIAQEKLDDVISNSNVNKAQLTKVTDRFKTKIHLEATEVDIIIKNRLLKKTPKGIEQLKANYEKKSGQILDHASIIGSGITKTDSFESYSTYYPFYKYQFDLLQNFLFGTKGYASTKVAARGMIHTTYEILKLDIQNNELFDTVTGWQITKEGQPQPDIRLVNRYDNAERILKEEKSVIHGRKLLETIHLLSEAEVTPTTLANIIKCYISNPEQYHVLKSAMEQALNSLTEAKVLLDTNNTYRITSDIEQRLLDEMSEYVVQGFTKKKKLVTAYGNAQFTKQLSKITEDNSIYDFYITTDNDDELTKSSQKALKIRFKSIYSFSQDRLNDIEQLKLDYQQDKSTIWLVPDNSKFKKIDRLIDEIERIFNLEQKYRDSKSDEGKIMLGFSTSKEEKQVELRKLVEEAFINGTLIYLFNTFQLTKDNWEDLLKKQQREVIHNVFSKRLKTQLSDDLAKVVIKQGNNNRLSQHFNGDDFTFFDTQGNFIGERLKVVEEILYKIKHTFVDGKTLESELENPPTGFTLGTVMTTLAVLLRAGRVIAKNNGRDFYSWQDKGVDEVFLTARKFRMASFKAISKTLSAAQKQAIAKFLLDLDITKYRDKEDVKIDYNTNDFELVNAVRGLAKYFDRLVTQLNSKEDNFDTLFPDIQAEVDNLQTFTSAVSEANYIDKAAHFLTNQANFYNSIKAIQQVEKFIDKKLPKAKTWQIFITEVKEELKKGGQINDNIEVNATAFETSFKENVVSNYQTLRGLTQKVKDDYYQLFSAAMQDCATRYKQLEQEADDLITEINQLPKGLNNEATRKATQAKRYAEQRTQATVQIDFEVKDKASRFTYSEVASFIDLYSGKSTELEILKASLVREAPKPTITTTEKNTSTVEEMPQQPIAPPKKYTYKTTIPSKKMAVATYRDWLKNELRKLANAKDSDNIEITD